MDASWTMATNWSRIAAPLENDALVFAGTNGVSINDFSSGTRFEGLSFSAGASSFHLSGNMLTLAGDLSDASTARQTVDIPIELSGTSRTITVADGGELEISMGLSGLANMVKDGGGLLTLSAANTHTGGTVVNDGTVELFSSSSFSGSPLPGMAYWLDASSLSSVVIGSGGAVSQWSDLSGNGCDFFQSDPDLQPVYSADAMYGKPGLIFDGVDDQLVFGSAATPRTVFIVHQVDAAQSLKGIWGAPDGADKGLRMASASSWRTAQDANDFTYPSGSELYVNGVGTAGFSAATPQLVGAARSTAMEYAKTAIGGYYTGRFFSGRISEVIVYDWVLSESERAVVETYLMDKWIHVDAPPIKDSVLWLDAANRNSLVMDGDNKISQWNDSADGGGPSYASQATASSQPILVNDELNGKPVVDFGAYSTSGTGQWLAFDSEISTIRTVFWVGRGANFILTDNGTHHFHRGGNKATSTIWHPSWTHANIRNGQTWLDGTSVNGVTTALPDAYSMVSMVTVGGVKAGRIALDRTSRCGGQQLAEILIYDRGTLRRGATSHRGLSPPQMVR